MPADGIAYEVTEAGRNAWQSQDRSIPVDYRLVLWLIDFYGADYLKDPGQRYSSQLLHGLLSELEELKFIQPLPAGAASKGLAANDPDRTLAFSLHEQRRFERELQSASQSLLKGKAYIAEERLGKRRALGKPPAEAIVLVVEDDPDQRALADLRVSMAGYNVWIAESARALADTLATRGVPDVLLLDVMLPDGNGFEILRRLRAHPSYSNLPVIMLTAKTKPDDIATGLKHGADGYITKPYSKAVLHDLLKRVVGQ